MTATRTARPAANAARSLNAHAFIIIDHWDRFQHLDGDQVGRRVAEALNSMTRLQAFKWLAAHLRGDLHEYNTYRHPLLDDVVFWKAYDFTVWYCHENGQFYHYI